MVPPTQDASQFNKSTIGFGIASITAIIFNTILTIAKESYPPLLAFMKNFSVFGVKHHWLLHGLTIVIIFYLFGWLFSKQGSNITINGNALTKTIAWVTILSSLGIVIFFLVELF